MVPHVPDLDLLADAQRFDARSFHFLSNHTERGKRYRLAMSNKSGDNHPVHLHRHTFEVTKVGDKATAGVMKDTVNMTRFSTVEIDFVADDPGPSLLHCHHQDHQDEGFMGLVTYL
jgi:FtsP/CotA-like multicopper oxidase with cupredoxin domain